MIISELSLGPSNGMISKLRGGIMKFVPRRDLWLSCVIWLSVIGLVVTGISPLLFEGAGLWEGAAVMVICLGLAGLFAWFWMNICYELRESELFIRNGPFKLTIPYVKIIRITPTRSWLASMATSSRRLEIKYGKFDYVHISPLDQERFLQELKRLSPEINIEDKAR